jgi:endoglucanase
MRPLAAAPSPDRIEVLRRGVNITNWFRFPPSLAPAALQAYLGDTAIAELRRAGFTFVRLAVQPEILLRPDGSVDGEREALVTEAVARLERQGLGVLVELHPATWQLEASAADRAKLQAVWRSLAYALRPFDPRLTFPEVLNEPVFKDDPAGWEALQASVLATIRAALPAATIVLTGSAWGGLDGLLRLHPSADPNVIYSFHFYEPTLLTTLGAYQQGLDQAGLVALPFPVADPATCDRIAASGPTLGAVRWYCAERWDSGRVQARIAAAGAWGRGNRVAVLAGEFGARDRLNPAAPLAWLQAVRAACEAQDIGWALWGYEDSFGFGVPRPPGDAPVLDPQVLQALGLQQ